MKTPEERSQVVDRANARARKGYKVNTRTRRTDVGDEQKEIITMQLLALKVIGGYSNIQCAQIVGISRGQVRAIVQDEKFKRQVTTVAKTLPAAALNLGQAYLVEAVQAVVHVMRTESDNALVLKAAAEMFDRFGLPKLTKAEVQTTPPPDSNPLGADKNFMDKLREASPEIQEQVAQLHESFVEGVSRILNGDENGSD